MNPAFRIALNETLGRQATPEEWFAYSLTLQRLLGGSRVYVGAGKCDDAEHQQKIVLLHTQGLSVRRIARDTRCSRWRVRKVLAGKLALETDQQGGQPTRGES